MHAPDGFLTAPTAITTGLMSAGAIGGAIRASRPELDDDRIPLAGVTAAFVFAAQMVNFPVAAGTTGHLLGGALAAVLLGPSLGLLVVAVVVLVQALAFADGGLTALGYNLLNMSVVTALGGWAVFRGSRRLLPATTAGVTVAAAVAAFASVLLSAMAFSLEWLFGASAAVPFDRVFVAMVGVHTLIGVGEALITAGVVAAVLAVRPDLVRGADGIGPTARRGRLSRPRFVVTGVVVALLVAVGVSQFAVDAPDGLERVAEDLAFAEQGAEHTLSDAIFSDYATDGVSSAPVSLAIAGTAGTLLTLAIGSGLFLLLRDRPRRVMR
ncbi:MAG: energy-coupling factor ABC transporter permease [Nitriliruptoraceae bacterium]